MNMFEAESTIAAPALSIEHIPMKSSILSSMMSPQDPIRAETINEHDVYINSFKSIKGGNVMTTECLHSHTIGDKFGIYVNGKRMLRCRRSTTDKSKARYYCNLFDWIESPFMHNVPRNYMHQGHDNFLCTIKLCFVQMCSFHIIATTVVLSIIANMHS